MKIRFSTDLKKIEKEVEFRFYRSSGPGGQRKNSKETAVKIYHPLSGITVTATEYRSQARNRELAMIRLQERLKRLNIRKKLRIPTQKPSSIHERILEGKKKDSAKKQYRIKINPQTIDLQ